MVQQSTIAMTRKTELVRILDVFGKRYTKLANSEKCVDKESMKMAAELEQKKRAMINLTLKLEGLQEELQTYKELPSILKQCQIDNEQTKEELRKMKAKYQQVTDSLVYHTGLRKDLSKECFHRLKENEKLKHDMELLRIKLHESLEKAQPSRQAVESVLLQEEKQRVILITKQKDEYKAEVERLKQEVIVITRECDQLSLWLIKWNNIQQVD